MLRLPVPSSHCSFIFLPMASSDSKPFPVKTDDAFISCTVTPTTLNLYPSRATRVQNSRSATCVGVVFQAPALPTNGALSESDHSSRNQHQELRRSQLVPPLPAPSPCGRTGAPPPATSRSPPLRRSPPPLPPATAGGVARQSPGGVVVAADLVDSGQVGEAALHSGDGRRSGGSRAARGVEVGRPLWGHRRPADELEDG
jgi:hypothetical protein